MIVIRLWGGLGNQMFQYAFGYAQARKHHTELVLDTRFYSDEFIKANPRFTKQQLNLLKLPVDYTAQINFAGELRLINMLQSKTISRAIRLFPKFIVIADRHLKYVKETRLDYLPYIDQITDCQFYFDGYWQAQDYFLQYKDDLKRQFQLDSPAAYAYAKAHQLQKSDTVAVHMRLGDYAVQKKKFNQVNSPINPIYYQKAIDEISNKIITPRFFIFSNDMKQAKKILGDRSEYTFVNEDRNMNDMDEFQIMSLCSNHIISNSTFSWWAAWLSSERGINIAPDVFFGNQAIILPEWIKINVSA